MNLVKKQTLLRSVAVLTSALLLVMTTPAFGQDYPPPPAGQEYPPPSGGQDYPPPPILSPDQLDNLVGRIALYPDPLLAQVLAAATFPDQIPDAAGWAMQNRYLRGDDLANAIAQANLPWDPSVQALLPFPTVLDMMARDMNWTSQLGDAVLAQRPDVMDAVQRLRREAEGYGYLTTGPQIRVLDDGQYVQVLPVNAGYIWVPVYSPFVVFAPPGPGFFVGGAIGFGAGFVIGPSFGAWGWGGGFDWHAHSVFVHNAVWGRTWANRNVYVHNYGNWNGGRWRSAAVNRNVYVNNTRNVYNGNQRFAVTPSRGYEKQTEPEHSGAFHGTENGRADHAAAAWGRASRGGDASHGNNDKGGRR